jgi:hypothetical protein
MVAMITTTLFRRSSKVFVVLIRKQDYSGWHECLSLVMTQNSLRAVW